jgi:flavin-dependent dehydrogenase
VTETAEIVVAGGGPVGLLAAHAFARMGAESLVLETRPDDAPPNRGDARRMGIKNYKQFRKTEKKTKRKKKNNNRRN